MLFSETFHRLMLLRVLRAEHGNIGPSLRTASVGISRDARDDSRSCAIKDKGGKLLTATLVGSVCRTVQAQARRLWDSDPHRECRLRLC
jgi:hypothetical protein